jgi:CCR4-NOT transcriptional regulation complex NOT5 subunit
VRFSEEPASTFNKEHVDEHEDGAGRGAGTLSFPPISSWEDAPSPGVKKRAQDAESREERLKRIMAGANGNDDEDKHASVTVQLPVIVASAHTTVVTQTVHDSVPVLVPAVAPSAPVDDVQQSLRLLRQRKQSSASSTSMLDAAAGATVASSVSANHNTVHGSTITTVTTTTSTRVALSSSGSVEPSSAVKRRQREDERAADAAVSAAAVRDRDTEKTRKLLQEVKGSDETAIAEQVDALAAQSALEAKKRTMLLQKVQTARRVM